MEEKIHQDCMANEDDFKALQYTLDMIGSKWRPRILYSISVGENTRFNEVCNSLPGLSSRMLSRELKLMVELKLVERVVRNTHPITIEYKVTELGLSLSPVFSEMVKWGHEHMK